MITRAVRDDKHGSRTPRRRTLLLLGMLVVLLWVHVQLGAQVDLVDHHLGGDTVRAAEAKLIVEIAAPAVHLARKRHRQRVVDPRRDVTDPGVLAPAVPLRTQQPLREDGL